MPIPYTAPKRIVCHFSCGAASAIATKLAIEKYRDSGIPIVILNLFLAAEHPDNERFLKECEQWFGLPITQIRNEKYKGDPQEVWRRVRYIVGKDGAACTRILKREPSKAFWQEGDLEVFGYTAGEEDRLDNFIDANPLRTPWAPLQDGKGFTKSACLAELKGAGIELPMMYRLGFANNNCIGCPKGGAGYWNQIRIHFPKVFEEVGWIEEVLGAPFVKVQRDNVRRRVYLTDLPPDAGRHEAPEDISCGYVCSWPDSAGARGLNGDEDEL